MKVLLKEETAPERGSASGGLNARHSKANHQATLVERKFALFQMLAMGRGRWQTSVQRLTSPPTPPNKQEVTHTPPHTTQQADRVGWGEVTCRNSTVISNRHLQLVISGLTGIILTVTGTVNLQFWDAPVLMSLKSILRIVAAQVLDKVNCFT